MGGMTTWLVIAVMIFIMLYVGLTAWRATDRRADNAAWSRLIALGRDDAALFDHSMVADLPEPARRYFLYTIKPGTPIRTAVEIEMTGELGLGAKDAPNYRPMHAHQILSPPHGLVWKLRSGPISGSDGATPEKSWTRFWLHNLAPIVRVSGVDHKRSAFGRVIAEGAFWTPAFLLPSGLVEWEDVDPKTARAIVRYGRFEQAVDITIRDDGEPTRVVIQRWSNANAEKVYREQPFGGDLADFKDFDGYRLPTRVDGGNLIGTPDYFPFFRAKVTDVRFLTSQPDEH